MDEQELIENPEALLTLMQQSVLHLLEQRPDTAEQEAQLRAVARAIEQLEKQRIPVPDSLRQTKMNLVDQIGQYAQANCRLRELGTGLTEVQHIIEKATGGEFPSDKKPRKESAPRQSRSRENGLLATPQAKFGEYLVKALVDLGGSAHCSDVLDRMTELLEGKLLPGDLMPRESLKNGQLVWQNNTH